MKPLIYIAAGAKEVLRVEKQIPRVEEMGYVVIPWEEHKDVDVDLISLEDWKKIASKTRESIGRCSILWLMSGRNASAAYGGYIELGIALESGKEVLYSGRVKPRGVLSHARCFQKTYQVLDYLHERLHGGPMPEDMRMRWWPSVETPKPVNVPVPAKPQSPKLDKSSNNTPAAKNTSAAVAVHGGRLKATLIGRHMSNPEVTNGYVTLRVPAHAAVGSFPTGLPVPTTPEEYRVLVSSKQWAKISSALAADAEDRFVLDGFPTVEGNTIALYVMGATTTSMQAKNKPLSSSPTTQPQPTSKRLTVPEIEVIRRRS